MTGSDKLFHKKMIKVTKSRGLQDDQLDENPYYKSQYNDDRNLENFENDQIFRHQIRAMNDNSDIDPSDTELADDNYALNQIDDNDEIFSLRRKKKDIEAEEAELLESSGDDLDRDFDDDLLMQQNEDETIDIDTKIKQQTMEDAEDEEDSDMISEDSQFEDDDAETEKIKKRKPKGKGKQKKKEIESQLMAGIGAKDENEKRLLSLSKQFAANKVAQNGQLYGNGNESDGSSYYHSSSDDDDGNILNDIERNKYKPHSSDEDDDDYIAEEGVGREHWGDNVQNYYGADGVSDEFKNKSEREQYRELRDEEAIGMQMEEDEMKYHREKDFVDLEMQMLMEEELKKENEEIAQKNAIEKRKKKRQKKKEKKKRKIEALEAANKFSTWFKDENEDEENEDEDMLNKTDDKAAEEAEIGRANVEKIQKAKIGSEQAKIIRRDHPELPGMLKELKEIVAEMESVFKVRQRAVKKRFDEAIEDSTLFVELLRTYSSTICFYLQLKAKKVDAERMKQHGIFSVLLKLKRQVYGFRKIYKKSIEFLNNLPKNWDRSEYLAQKRELFEYEKKRQLEVAERRKEKEAEEERLKKIENKKVRKMKKKEEKYKSTLFQRGFNRLNNSDKKLEGDDERRHITQKIFKSQGLKRYRKPGIPRVKARIKYDKKMKLWKRKGYTKFKGKIPNGRMENNINTKWTHSKRLT